MTFGFDFWSQLYHRHLSRPPPRTHYSRLAFAENTIRWCWVFLVSSIEKTVYFLFSFFFADVSSYFCCCCHWFVVVNCFCVLWGIRFLFSVFILVLVSYDDTNRHIFSPICLNVQCETSYRHQFTAICIFIYIYMHVLWAFTIDYFACVSNYI